MNRTRSAWISYILLRLAFFAIPLAAMLALQITPWLAVIFAGLISASLSVLLLTRQRSIASESIHEWRTKDRTADDIAEDTAIDS